MVDYADSESMAVDINLDFGQGGGDTIQALREFTDLMQNNLLGSGGSWEQAIEGIKAQTILYNDTIDKLTDLHLTVMPHAWKNAEQTAERIGEILDNFSRSSTAVGQVYGGQTDGGQAMLNKDQQHIQKQIAEINAEELSKALVNALEKGGESSHGSSPSTHPSAPGSPHQNAIQELEGVLGKYGFRANLGRYQQVAEAGVTGLSGESGILGTLGKGGLYGVAAGIGLTAGYNEMRNLAQYYTNARWFGNISGESPWEGLGYQARAWETSLNPFSGISGTEANRGAQALLQQGFKGTAFDQSWDFAVDAYKRYNLDLGTSAELLGKYVHEAKGNIGDLAVSLTTLKTEAKGSGISLKDLTDTFKNAVDAFTSQGAKDTEVSALSGWMGGATSAMGPGAAESKTPQALQSLLFSIPVKSMIGVPWNVPVTKPEQASAEVNAIFGTFLTGATKGLSDQQLEQGGYLQTWATMLSQLPGAGNVTPEQVRYLYSLWNQGPENVQANVEKAQQQAMSGAWQEANDQGGSMWQRLLAGPGMIAGGLPGAVILGGGGSAMWHGAQAGVETGYGAIKGLFTGDTSKLKEGGTDIGHAAEEGLNWLTFGHAFHGTLEKRKLEQQGFTPEQIDQMNKTNNVNLDLTPSAKELVQIMHDNKSLSNMVNYNQSIAKKYGVIDNPAGGYVDH